ncbi:MAG: type II toxin-antitoxin system HicA family toxin [Nitrospirae bacterium]|nr:type II toxin-antitoxin system HicA family toxin [Nitrospirota bacterium]
MKRKDLLAHLIRHGCMMVREGGRHTVYFNPKTNRTSTVPRHREINDFLTKKICKDLGIPIYK